MYSTSRRLLHNWGITSSRESFRFMLYTVIFHIGMMGMADVLMNFYFVSLGHTPDSIAFLQSLPRLGGFLTSIPMGLLANRIGARRMLIVATIGCSLMFIALAVFPSPLGLGLSRFLLGFLYGAQQIASSPLIMNLVSKEQQTRFFAAHNVVSMASMAVGSLIGGITPAVIVALTGPLTGVTDSQSAFAYGTALFLVGLSGFLSILPMLHITAAANTPKPRTVSLKPKHPAAWGKLLYMSLPLLFFGFSGGLTFPFYNLFFRVRFDQPDHAIGTILSVGWLGMAVVPLLNPWWEKRVGRVPALVITMTIAAVGFMGLGFVQTLALSVLCYLVGTSFRNVMQPLFQPLVMSYLPPEEYNLVSSTGMILWNVGWFSATASSGWLQKTIHFDGMMRLVSMGVLLTAASIWLIYRRKSLPHEPIAVPDLTG